MTALMQASEVRRPRLLDLFSGAGGCSMGYYRAGFDVVGVDIKPQAHYPAFHNADYAKHFTFIQADAMTYPLDGFDAIHASPPCQRYSCTSSLHNTAQPDLYDNIRTRLIWWGVPWVIENVIGAPYKSGLFLCGSMFALGVRRHRNFETSFLIMKTIECRHDLFPNPLDVTGTGGPGERENRFSGGEHRKPKNIKQAQEAMGIDWMTRAELSQAIPPAYCEWIGRQLMEYLTCPQP